MVLVDVDSYKKGMRKAHVLTLQEVLSPWQFQALPLEPETVDAHYFNRTVITSYFQERGCWSRRGFDW